MLTNLYNRRMFHIHLDKLIYDANYNNSTFSVIMFYIDRFKRINDKHGHLVGDYALKELSYLVKTYKGIEDQTYRYGGEEFIILLPGIALVKAINISVNLHKTIQNHYMKHIISLTVSMGVIEYKLKETPDDIIKRVDDLIYKAKRAGRNRVKHK